MGLDMYAQSVNSNGRNEIAYWRKHNRLHGWMCEKWLDQNPNKDDSDFNCVILAITSEMLDELEKTINNQSLPETSGFFFGSDSYEEYSDPDFGYKEVDKEFIKKAREAIQNGDTVEYSSWW